MESIYTCIVCPRGCRITVADGPCGPVATGQGCPRGRDYATSEHTHPMRTLTTTVRLEGADIRRLPVVSNSAIPRELLRKCLERVYEARATAPVATGDVIVADVCGTGVDVVAARSVRAS